MCGINIAFKFIRTPLRVNIANYLESMRQSGSDIMGMTKFGIMKLRTAIKLQLFTTRSVSEQKPHVF